VKEVKRKMTINIPGMRGIVDFPRAGKLVGSKDYVTRSALKKLGVSLPDNEARALALELFYHERFDHDGLGKEFFHVFVIGTSKIFVLSRKDIRARSNLIIWRLSSSFNPNDHIARFIPFPPA